MLARIPQPPGSITWCQSLAGCLRLLPVISEPTPSGLSGLRVPGHGCRRCCMASTPSPKIGTAPSTWSSTRPATRSAPYAGEDPPMAAAACLHHAGWSMLPTAVGKFTSSQAKPRASMQATAKPRATTSKQATARSFHPMGLQRVSSASATSSRSRICALHANGRLACRVWNAGDCCRKVITMAPKLSRGSSSRSAADALDNDQLIRQSIDEVVTDFDSTGASEAGGRQPRPQSPLKDQAESREPAEALVS